MDTGLILVGVIAVLGFVVLLSVVGIYNALVTLRNRYKNAYAQIEVFHRGSIARFAY